MADIDLAKRLDFLIIDQETRATLAAMRTTLQEALPSVLEAFYTHIARYPEAARHFGGATHMAHAKAMQLNHWMMIAEGDFSQSYVDSVRRIGLVHSKIGLEPRWYLAGYAFITSAMQDILIGKAASKGLFAAPKKLREAQRQVRAFNKAAMLDMDFAISIYLEENEAGKQKALREIASAFESSVAGVVEAVAASATELSQTARSMSGIAESTSSRAVTVSAAAEEASANISVVATASSQMGASVREIAGQVASSTRIAGEAVDRAQASANTIQKLSDAADKIGAVVSMISDIASQTNLLALNATIESARAGEAGKGFAVVAAEVKSLATQTSKATEDIGVQIGEMQAATRSAVEAISAIQRTIDEINSVSMAINAAVEEQAAATAEIGRNTGEAAMGASDVSRNIVHVQQGANETGAAAAEVVSASEELGRQAESLRREVSNFLTNVRAA